MDKLVVNYYEYKHPIINKDLAIGAHGGKKFPTLGAWYDVINEYEFQTRCPIILKNSHRNKHFTFACHLKNCPFKVLLSYAGNSASSEASSPSASNNANPSGPPDHIHHQSDNIDDDDDNGHNNNNKIGNDSKLEFVTDDLEYHLANTHPDDANDKMGSRNNDVGENNDDDADANNIFKQQGVNIKNDTEDDSINKSSIDQNLVDANVSASGSGSRNHDNNDEDDVHTQMTKNYSDVVNDEDINVAIANAVANVDSQSNNKHDGKDDGAPNNDDDNDSNINNDNGNNNAGNHDVSSHSPSSIRDTPMNLDVFNSATDDIPGPFVVTKIEPYHSHPLEDNLSLGKFILTKIPKILQNDLKFDQILESSYNSSNHTVSKFKVSHYVEESGLLDILMQRYGLTAEDFEKRLLSQIARRITTYKARFVLKKKKMGEYNDLQPSSSSNNNNNNNNNNDDELSNANMRNNSIDYTKHQEISSAGVSSNTTKNENDINNNKNDNTNVNSNNSSNDTSNLMEGVLDKTSSHRYQPKKLPNVNKWNKPDQITHSDVSMVGLDEPNEGGNENVHPTLAEVDAQEARETAQLAIDKIKSYKRSIDDKNRDGYHNSSRNVVDENLINDMDSEDNHKSKRQHLSDITLEERNEDDKLPHEVAEQLRLLSSHLKEVENLHQNNDDDVDDVMVDVDVESQYNKSSASHHSQPHHDQEDVAGLMGKPDDDDDDDDLSDENIQPELRGQ
ncbi:DNA-binding protein ABF1 SKDI_11G1040 [Saccharomyces kudriavzevii IFO 1802]|uniref:ABF1-like protein n=2 Tax=Saccharomyces kudriavzevii (strain ATCC MYA-4449 / AS 2.2408 / CBS 8840 / NBRC 1802 / NCYC 2889) TaxID=226230 RepID=J5S7P4_SACK1|nr:uncharacterized protein SKDI_11G1040 [Saccharomyces kudriavzevii IFO 1802]EJT44086.1 ABF1-like protein [Saccharomyces kudriavzevii IFO 1802]CAI4044631.1 hypothetical protein SKDI_11G1040 [Saccharomyces kudriavzevii IFO 1802]